MIVPLLALTLAPASSTAMMKPAQLIVETDRVASPAPDQAAVDELFVRLSSPAGVLWQGNLRVSQNQGASYSQNFSQASLTACPLNTAYDRSERSSISFNVYSQNNGDYGQIYRVDASWQRPTEETGCAERGSRTVQVTKALRLEPGQSGTIQGDAGLKVEVSRRR